MYSYVAMDMFVPNEDVAHWEQQLPLLYGSQRLVMLVALAWQFRQRDTNYSLQLADQAETLTARFLRGDIDSRELASLRARLLLVRAEAKWLMAKFTEAEQLAADALHVFLAIDSGNGKKGCCDAHYLLAAIALARGDRALLASELEFATIAALAANDAEREIMVQSFLANQTALSNLTLAQERWGERFRADMQNASPNIAGCIYDFFSITAALSSDFGQAITYGIQAYEHALQTGQIRRAVILTTNIGDAFNSLNDHQAALQWMQIGHDLAMPTNWPGSVGSCQMQLAETMRRLGRLEAARGLLNDTITILAPMSESRVYMMALRYQSDLLLDLGDYQQALQGFRLLQEKADVRDQFDFRIGARRGQAHALSMLGQPADALAIAEQALLLARHS
ncbi:hypothetical protein [Undibacterium sp. 10I3]|uniref:hypothetical protein n=2 Tax=unclassified Undibacterium TaxID=2630295 RepID=UPI002B22B7B7|nr:hypothetical protein [Undibacterium sp. 10I3]